MNTQISTKLAALAAALVMNSLLIGAVTYVFNAQIDRQQSTSTSSQRVAATPHAVA